MKHLVFVLTVVFAVAAFSSAFSEVVTYDDSWSEAGFNLISQSPSGVEVVFSIRRMAIEDLMVDGQTMKVVQLPGVFLPNDAGAPNLPGTGRFIAIPQGATANVQILSSRVEVIEDIEIAPAPPIPLETDDSPPVYHKDMSIYSRNAYYPDSPVKLSEPSKMRGVDYVILGITPFQYNPVTRELLVYRDLRVQIDFIGGSSDFGEDRLRSRYWEPILQGNLLNYASLPELDFNRFPEVVSEDENFEYVIIVPDDSDFIAWADTIKNWRNLQGIRTGVVTLSEIGGNFSFLIEQYIGNAYYNWEIPPVAVLLLSDYQMSGEGYGITSPTWNNYCVSDNIYADIEGNDDLPDIAIARITAQDAAHLATTINKFLDYERTPPTAANFYDEPLIAGGWQTDRWFILCCEVIHGFLEHRLGKHPVRQYAGYSGGAPPEWSTNQNTWMIIDYFGPEGLGYIPETPSHLTNWNGNADGINAAINSGAFIVQHRDHGDIDGWSEPHYLIPDLAGLHNDDYPFVFSMNCLTGKFNHYSECFAEAFHREEHRALGVTAASEVSYSFVNDTYTWGMYDCIWPDFDPGYGYDPIGPSNSRVCFASAYGKYYLEASGWPYNTSNKVHTYHLFHHHGDAFITLFSEVPQNLTVSHDPVMYSGVKEFTVTADVGAIIALTVNGEIIGVAEGTGLPFPIQIAPQQAGNTMVVTVTKMNYHRYTEEVPIVPATGAHVVYDSLEINDSSGNNNGLLDYAEDVYLSITVKNIGTATANNVNVFISTDDSYATILDSLENYGDIPAGSTKVVTDGFEIEASPLIPDLHVITFAQTATSDDGVWTSHFNILAHSPTTEFESVAIADSAGNNNGNLDPGETVDFHVTVKNKGTSDAFDIWVELGCDHPDITVPGDPAFIPSLASGEEVVVVFSGVSADLYTPNGSEVWFTLDFSARGGYTHSDDFTVLVGDLRFLPTGPDGYGYRAYDMWETFGAPEYDWLEIAPMAGGNGTVIDLADDQTARVGLPFTFRYYGRDFNRISICSNGWIKIGYTTNTSRWNSPIPTSWDPNNIIAACWCNLNPDNGGQICCYYDTTNHRCIVEWYQVPHYTNIGPNTFQIMLLDPAYYPTPSGDGEIILNYQELANLAMCSVGMENHNGEIGLQYLFNDSYSQHAMPIETPCAIRFTTVADGVSNLVLTMTPLDPPVVIPPEGGYFEYSVVIDNLGPLPIDIDIWTDVIAPNGTPFGPLLLRTGKTLPPSSVTERTVTQYVPGRAPSGEYTYWGHLGDYPSSVETEDSFLFTKEPGDFTGLSRFTEWTVIGWEEGEALASLAIPEDYYLAQSFPNPFNARTTISYQLPVSSQVKLEVYNVLGQKVATVVDEKQQAGYRSVSWDASEVSSGLYFYKLTAGDFTETRRMMVVK